MDESNEHYIKFLEAREDAPESLQSPEQSLNLVTPPIHNLVVLPRLKPVGLGRHYRDEAKVQCELPCFVPFVGSIHQQMNGPAGLAQVVEQLASLGGIVSLSGGQCKRYGRSSIRGLSAEQGNVSAKARLRELGEEAVIYSEPTNHAVIKDSSEKTSGQSAQIPVKESFAKTGRTRGRNIILIYLARRPRLGFRRKENVGVQL